MGNCICHLNGYEIKDAAARRNVANEIDRAKAKENELEAKDKELEELFTLPTEEAVGKWLSEHPEVTTTVQDGSLTEEKLTDELRAKMLKDYVTPEMFGAVGDGVTDDTQAIIDCSSYCATNKVKMYSGEGNYLTGTNCIIRNVDDVELNGTFTYLEFVHNPNNADSRTVKVKNCSELVIRDYKGSRFTFGKIHKLSIIANSELNSESSFAYNHLSDGIVDELHIIGLGSGWINENVFEKIRIKNINIDSVYSPNHNKFYDITVDAGGVLNFGNAHSNYVSLRGEGGYTLNVDNAENNIIEETWCNSTPLVFAEKYDNYVGTNMQIRSAQSKYLLKTPILDKNIFNVLYNSNTNFQAFKYHIDAWKNYNEKPLLVLANQPLIFKFFSDVKHFRVQVRLFDENMNPVNKETENIFRGSSFTYREEYTRYDIQSNVSKCVFTVEKGTIVKYIEIVITNGNTACDVTYLNGHVESLLKPIILNGNYDGITSTTLPTVTEGVPKGLKILNIGTTETALFWTFNGSEWVSSEIN